MYRVMVCRGGKGLIFVLISYWEFYLVRKKLYFSEFKLVLVLLLVFLYCFRCLYYDVYRIINVIVLV